MDRSYSLVAFLMVAGVSAAACAVETDAFDLDIDDVASESMESTAYSSNTWAYRNTYDYDISQSGGPWVSLTVSTYPIQPYAPVYSWRTHTRHTGPGPYGYYGNLIGTTNSQGVLVIQGILPNDSTLCGAYTNEQFAVGSRWAPRSPPLDFQIYRGIDFSPPDPDCIGYW